MTIAPANTNDFDLDHVRFAGRGGLLQSIQKTPAPLRCVVVAPSAQQVTAPAAGHGR